MITFCLFLHTIPTFLESGLDILCVFPTNTLITKQTHTSVADSTYGSSRNEGEKKTASTHLMRDFLHKTWHTSHDSKTQETRRASVQRIITVCLCGLQLERIFPPENISHPSPAPGAGLTSLITRAYLLPPLFTAHLHVVMKDSRALKHL